MKEKIKATIHDARMGNVDLEDSLNYILTLMEDYELSVRESILNNINSLKTKDNTDVHGVKTEYIEKEKVVELITRP